MIGLTLPVLIQDGMFMDAMLYTSVSHNLSQGYGSFWFPQFSVHNIAGLSSFHEQPPLVFGIQAVFFKLFGDSMYVERFYTFITMCITAWLIARSWRNIYSDEFEIKKNAWLPILLWITIPVCFWSYSNNMHENTMGIFIVCAGLFAFKGFNTSNKNLLYCGISGLFIFLASLSKGIPGFFPIVAPGLYWLITKKITLKKAMVQTIVITMIPVLIYTILFLIPESKESLSIYLFKRALHRINEVPTVDSRFYIIGRLFSELIPSLSLVLIFFIIAKLKRLTTSNSEKTKEALFFICLGIAGSAPLLLTMVQKGFYFVPSLPFFAIGLGMLISPTVTALIQKIKINSTGFKISLVTSLLLFTGAIVFTISQKGKTSRDQELQHDVYIVGAAIPKKSTVSIPQVMWNDWTMQCNLIRYYTISLETDTYNKYYLLDRSLNISAPEGYEKISLPTLKYDVYKKK